MSITLGIYDLFSYLVPGILYLYIINEFLTLLGLAHIELQNADNIAAGILMVIASYIFGQTFDLGAVKWRKWRQPKESGVEAIERLKNNYPDIKIDFAHKDSGLLLSFIRRKHPEVATTIDRHKAICIMLQNISFGALLYTLLQFVSFFLDNYSVEHLLLAFLIFGIALLAKQKSRLYNRWFYNNVYEIAFTYDSDPNKLIKKIQANDLRRDQ